MLVVVEKISTDISSMKRFAHGSVFYWTGPMHPLLELDCAGPNTCLPRRIHRVRQAGAGML